MAYLSLGEITRHVVCLKVTHSPVPKSVKSAAWNRKAITQRIQHFTQHIAGIKRRPIPALKDAAQSAATEILLEHLNRA
jgi:hypothetical protein